MVQFVAYFFYLLIYVVKLWHVHWFFFWFFFRVLFSSWMFWLLGVSILLLSSGFVGSGRPGRFFIRVKKFLRLFILSLFFFLFFLKFHSSSFVKFDFIPHLFINSSLFSSFFSYLFFQTKKLRFELSNLILSFLLCFIELVFGHGESFLKLLDFINANLLHFFIVVSQRLKIPFFGSHSSFI